ncbi:hypothetical protein IQ13_1403 [Lacibacter cauensis]|uniref:Phosphoribosyl transferase-like protein n=1 Tax=Lacibacter cauensis TaxID=510947 RepID=A0A562SPT5_9BACT|nr:hypothetical protein [Lacibacter cauensis]TWI83295.1 hypothetical protein IQ13_1403 [Lacibacter cauensis]
MTIGAFSIYECGKRGEEQIITNSKSIIANTKACRLSFFEKYLNETMDVSIRDSLSKLIPPNATLIPLPKSAPLVTNAQWPGRDICEILIANGFGKNYKPLLKRTKAVPKAAFQHGSEDRPTVQTHYDSIVFEDEPLFTRSIETIVLVDDVITQGRMSAACSLRVMEALPNVTAGLFGLIRTNTFTNIENVINPKHSNVLYFPDSGKTFHKIL